MELLANAAAASTGLEQRAARISLTTLSGSGVDETLIDLAGAGETTMRSEAIRALAGRKAACAEDKLMKLAKDDDDGVRREAILALGIVASETGIRDFIHLAVKPKSIEDRAAIEQAMITISGRSGDKDHLAAMVLAEFNRAPDEARPVLVRLLGLTSAPKALKAICAALKDDDARIHDAAVRTLSDWSDIEAADELLILAHSADSLVHRVLALRGYLRLAPQSEDQTGMYVRAMEIARRPEDKIQVLAGIGSTKSVETLSLAEQYMKDPQIRTEAAMAAVRIAERLRKSEPARVREAIENILSTVKEPNILTKAQRVLDNLNKQ